jgi:hypothetical protein
MSINVIERNDSSLQLCQDLYRPRWHNNKNNDDDDDDDDDGNNNNNNNNNNFMNTNLSC